VLVAGGRSSEFGYAATAELYDPATGTWTFTGSLQNARSLHTATLLSSGLVLAAAGSINSRDEILASAELYDSVSGTWSETGNLNVARDQHTATLLPNGTVLVAGGAAADNSSLVSAEIYDPITGTWSNTGNLNVARSVHGANLLLNGMVLAEGGFSTTFDTAELYDPGTVAATQASGRGSINGVGDQATFNFHATLSGTRPSGSLTFNDPAALVSISKAKVRTLTFTGNSATFGGTARLGSGSKVSYSVTVSDNSADGSTDTFAISLSNGYSAGGTLVSGDIQVQ
jgi:hypothetical protein